MLYKFVKKTILVIEDEPTIRLNICDWLELENFNVYSAEDGLSGLELTKELPIDLIICDIKMPNLNGFEVLQELRKNVSTASIPFIFLTSEVDRESRWKAMQLGANDYISKPIRLQDFLAVITNQFSPNPKINKNRLEMLCTVFD